MAHVSDILKQGRDHADPERPRRRLRQYLAEHYSIRWHMTLMLIAVCLSGIVASKVLLAFGLHSIRARYPVAVIVSYAVFFGFLRLWLWSMGLTRTAPARRRSDHAAFDVDPTDLLNNDWGWFLRDGGGNPSGASGFGGGGDFGGGGATDYWGSATSESAQRVSASTQRGSFDSSHASSGGNRGLGSFDIGDEGMVLIVFGILLLVIFGAGVYLVWEAPVILSEAAFEVLLASGVWKAAKSASRTGWIGSAFRATLIPFAIVLAMTVVFGMVAHHYCPHAATLADIIRGCGTRS